MTQLATCSGCYSTWTGNRACHCSHCHQTFGGLSLFDAHRGPKGCKTPQEAGATRLVDGVWRGPEYVPDIAKKAVA